MADVLKYDEGIVLPDGYKSPSEMLPQSVVFIFNDNTIPPISCNLDYLYARTRQTKEYPADSTEIGLNLNKETKAATNLSILPTNYYSDSEYKTGEYYMSVKRDWCYNDVIKSYIFKYGLKHEYYKNIHGKWIDMNTVRPHLALLNPYNSIFFSLTSLETISDLSKETSVYVKLCDNRHFSDDSWSKFRVSDINDIPEVEYIVKSSNSNDGTIYKIKRGDGTYDIEDIPVNVFEEAGQTYKDNIHTIDDEYAKFVIKLGDHSSNEIGSGQVNNNDHHKYDDLYITFFKADGVTPFTDIGNMFIVCNNMVVDYVKATNVDNAIYLPNVVKYAEIQRLTCYNKPSAYVKKTASPLQLSTRKNATSYVLDFDIPNTEYGYSYKFEIKIYKWKNVSVSHFIEPLMYTSILKTTSMEANKMFWLKTGATFASPIDKSKTILLCGNEIIPQSEWEVDRYESNKIKILGLQEEFDILYSEIYKKMSDYMKTYGLLNEENRPKIADYVNADGEHYDANKTPQERFDAYIKAVTEYVSQSSASALPFDMHYAPSTFDTVMKQFLYKQFAIIKFDTLDEANYTVELYENHADVEVDKPYTNHIRNINWSPDDLLVVNGLIHTFVNVYSDVFTPPTKWYLPVLDNVFEGANVYKLQVKRREIKKNFYMKLNYTELLAGPIDSLQYFVYNETKDIYLSADVTSGFDSTYNKLSSGETFNANSVYFTKDNSGNFVRVPTTVTAFENGVTYYTKAFNQVYYVLK